MLRTGIYTGAQIFGLTDVDDFVMRRLDPANNSFEQIALESIELSLATATLKGGGKGPGMGMSPHPKIEILAEHQIDRSLLNSPSKPGKAPTFKSDGTPVEIHHVEQGPGGPFVEMHWIDHRRKENDLKSHPNKGSKSEIDRIEFNKAKKAYWMEQFFPDKKKTGNE